MSHTSWGHTLPCASSSHAGRLCWLGQGLSVPVAGCTDNWESANCAVRRLSITDGANRMPISQHCLLRPQLRIRSPRASTLKAYFASWAAGEGSNISIATRPSTLPSAKLGEPVNAAMQRVWYFKLLSLGGCSRASSLQEHNNTSLVAVAAKLCLMRTPAQHTVLLADQPKKRMPCQGLPTGQSTCSAAAAGCCGHYPPTY